MYANLGESPPLPQRERRKPVVVVMGVTGAGTSRLVVDLADHFVGDHAVLPRPRQVRDLASLLELVAQTLAVYDRQVNVMGHGSICLRAIGKLKADLFCPLPTWFHPAPCINFFV